MTKLALFDLDHTLIDTGFTNPFPEAKKVLEKAREMGYRLCVVSNNDWARDILELLGFDKYFDFINGINGVTKSYLIRCTLSRYLDHTFEEVIHFDDDPAVVEEITRNFDFITSVHVNRNVGVTFADFYSAIELYPAANNTGLKRKTPIENAQESKCNQ